MLVAKDVKDAKAVQVSTVIPTTYDQLLEALVVLVHWFEFEGKGSDPQEDHKSPTQQAVVELPSHQTELVAVEAFQKDLVVAVEQQDLQMGIDHWVVVLEVPCQRLQTEHSGPFEGFEQTEDSVQMDLVAGLGIEVAEQTEGSVQMDWVAELVVAASFAGTAAVAVAASSFVVAQLSKDKTRPLCSIPDCWYMLPSCDKRSVVFFCCCWCCCCCCC